MSLSRFHVSAAIAVSDMERAEAFYEGRLGLSADPRRSGPENRSYPCADGSIVHVFTSPHAGDATATLAGWRVDDIERVVDELTAEGVVFERYDEPPIVTDAKGIASFAGGNRVAYFRDPDGNVLSIAQVADDPRSAS
jgi:catechol 2,3-dioxygenase-like lactoylglutathione lyase family enzyme